VYLNKPGADHNIIEGNVFHGIGRYHIRVGVGVAPPYSADNLIQDNSFYEYGYRDSGWSWYQQKDYAFSVGVRLSHAGPGNVIRRNTFKSGQDAINVNWQSHNTDVYENVIEEYMGDGIEVDDQPGHNIRAWDNVIRYCYSSISNQDWFTGDYWNTGPVYIFRNVVQGGFDPQGRTDVEGGIAGYYTNYGFKVGTDEDGPGRVHYYHNTISIPESPLGPPWGGHGIQDSGGDHFSGIVSRNNLWNIRARIFYLRYPTTVANHNLDCDNLHNLVPDYAFIQWSNDGGPEGNGTYRTLEDFQAYTGQELHAISDNGTLFNSDLSLQTGSPEIDAGCVIVGFNDRGPWAYTGQAPDIGAFELLAPNLTTSSKTANSTTLSTGDSVTYTVRIVNTGTPLTSTVVMTDTLPIGLNYLDGTLTATFGTAWVEQATATSVHWQGLLSDTSVIEIRYGGHIITTDTVALRNTAWIDDGRTQVIGRSAVVLVNGIPYYVPIILRHYE
jgi:uncharacterized repeat protein (TIGR01451 family)